MSKQRDEGLYVADIRDAIDSILPLSPATPLRWIPGQELIATVERRRGDEELRGWRVPPRAVNRASSSPCTLAVARIRARSEVGIRVVDTNNATVKGNTVRVSFYDGISLDSQSLPTEFNTVQDNHINDNGGAGISLYFADSNLIARNTTSRNGVDGILVDTSSGNTFQRNISRNNDAYGIFDSSTGTGTANTANLYPPGNQCTLNGIAKSSPSGLC